MKTLLEQKNAAIERVRKLSDEVKSLIEKVEAGTASEEEMKSVNAKADEMKAAKADVERFQTMIDAEEAAKAAKKEFHTPVNDFGGAKPEAKSNTVQEYKTAGDEFVNSQEFQAQVAEMKKYGSGGFPKGHRVNTQPVAVKTLVSTAGASFGDLIDAQRIQTIDTTDFSKPLTLLQLIARQQTSSQMVEYPLHAGYVNNAAPTAQATASTGSSGAKPESGLGTITIENAIVRTIAHYIPVTRQALQDIPAVRSIINTALTYGLQETLEEQMLNGDGTGENMRGILNTPGIQNQPLLANPFVTLRRAIKNVQIGGRATPNAILMHPDDWENLEIQQDANGQYYSGNPFRNTTFSSNVWNLPIVVNETIAPGEAIVGDFRFAYLWESLAPVILLSDSHENYFTRNMIAILAEMRAAFGVVRPSAFCRVSLV